MKLTRLGLLIVAGSMCLNLPACQEEPVIPVAPKTAIESGHDLYQRLSCHGCHVRQGRNGEVGPVLDGVGSRLSRNELETQLLTPRRRQADSRMPSFAFVKPKELQALVDFLESLK